jgi:hypothetical protein
MSKNRFLAPKGKNLPLKLRGNPLSFAFSDCWFVYPRPNIAVKFLGGGAKLHNFIRNLKPTLSTFQVYKIDYCARYAAMRTGGNAQNICSRFLENSDSIWDFRDFGYQFQDIASTISVTESGQTVQLVKPISGNNNLTRLSPNNGALSDSVNGLLFSDQPNCAYALSARLPAVKTVLVVNRPSTYTVIDGDVIDYPIFLGDDSVFNFHPPLTSESTIFSTAFTSANFRAMRFRLDNIATLFADLTRYSTVKILTIASNTNNLTVGNVSLDRPFNGVSNRRFVGNYRLLFLSNNTYTDSELNELNVMCQLYSGLI